MTLSEHPELPGYFTSTYGGWEFDLAEDGDIENVKDAVLAWQEWLEFLVDRQDKLF